LVAWIRRKGWRPLWRSALGIGRENKPIWKNILTA
jgi:hypothetical protein